MKGDFSRLMFDPARGFSRVLSQQGRVTLDADANEQQAINLHLVRQFAADLIGPYGGPGDGFKLATVADAAGRSLGVTIAAGRYYVAGWMCENPTVCALRAFDEKLPVQPWLRDLPAAEAGTYIAWLDVWERHVSAIEADRAGDVADPNALREVALGGPDTASRAQVVWQVRLAPTGNPRRNQPIDDSVWSKLIEALRPAARGRLRAEAAKPSDDSGTPCTVSPRSRYRGIENQLYRVEVRRGGRGSLPGAVNAAGATFAWSRENGSVTFPVASVAGTMVKLADIWRDTRFALAPDDMVEIVDDAAALAAVAPGLHRITAYDPDTATVTLATAPALQSDTRDRPLLLRRWDHGGAPKFADDNGLAIIEDSWLPIEEGISIRFDHDAAQPAVYRPGDFWLIPARVALGDVLWPRDSSDQRVPIPQPPHGVDRHAAPLAVITVDANGGYTVTTDLTRRFKSLC